MLESDKKAFSEQMLGMGEYYSKSISPTLMRIYFEALERYSLEDVKYALNQHVDDSKAGSFFPKVSDISRHLKEPENAVEERAEIAWRELTAKLDAYEGPKCSDPVALAVIKNMGSWQDFCHTPVDKMEWKRKEFISLYKTFENAPLESLPASLPGIFELENHKKKHGQQGAISMGDVVKRLKGFNG